MNARGLALIVAVLCGTVAPAASAERKVPREGSGKPASATARPVTTKAVITAVDAAAGTVTVRDAKGMDTVLTVTADTKLLKSGKNAGIADLQPGDVVAVACVGAGADMRCVSIKVKAAKKAAKGVH